jgi:hypothetical protein
MHFPILTKMSQSYCKRIWFSYQQTNSRATPFWKARSLFYTQVNLIIKQAQMFYDKKTSSIVKSMAMLN